MLNTIPELIFAMVALNVGPFSREIIRGNLMQEESFVRRKEKKIYLASDKQMVT